jgi:transcriptional regulator with XRE-family HTH domain
MTSNVVSLEIVGVRLRSERKRLGLNQDEMAERGGIARNTQVAYEGAKRAFDANYLVSLASSGIDVGFIVTGRREGMSLTEEASELLDCFYALAGADQAALLQIARTMAGNTLPSQRLHTPPIGFTPAPSIGKAAE